MNRILVILVSLLIVACQGIDKPKKPKNLISKDKMEDVLYDLYVLNAAKSINKKVLESNGIQPETFLFQKHKIDSLQFVESNNYYAYDTKTYETIVEKVKERMENDKVKYDAIAKKEKKKQDSISEVKKNSRDSLPPKDRTFKVLKQVKN